MKCIRLRMKKRFNPSQRAAWDSATRWTAFLGGWGAGKTWIGARIFLRNVLSNPPGVDALLAAPFWSTVHRTTLREFRAVTPREFITGESKKEHYLEVLGRRVYYGSADRPETLDGPTVGAVWLDEGRYVKRTGWNVVFSRLRSKKAKVVRGLVTSTPGGEWLEEEFGTGRPNRQPIHGSTRENAHNLADGTIADLEQTLSERAAQVYLEGQFGILEGAVYAFDKRRHLIPWKYNPALPVYVCWDFGWQRPAVLFIQPIPVGTPIPPAEKTTVWRKALPGTWVIVDELVPDEISTEALAGAVKAKPYRAPSMLYCDPAGDGTQPALGTSDVKELRKAGFQAVRFVTEPRMRYVPFGVRIIESLLRNVRGETRLYVAAHLDKPTAKRGVVKDFGGYRYPDKKEGRPVTDQPLKDGVHDHTMDALRYFGINELGRIYSGTGSISAM